MTANDNKIGYFCYKGRRNEGKRKTVIYLVVNDRYCGQRPLIYQ